MTSLRPLAAFLLLSLTVLGLAPTLSADMTRYLGDWTLDVPATLTYSKQSPKYDASSAPTLTANLERMSGLMSLTVTPEQVVLTRGKRAMPLPYTVESATADQTKVAFAVGAQSGHLTFTPVGENGINFKSSLSDDMNFLVWKPAAATTDTTTSAAPQPAASASGTDRDDVADRIRQNLEQILNKAPYYALEYGNKPVTYAGIVKAGHLKPLRPVAGEDYKTTVIDLEAGTATVTDTAGKTHTFKR